MKSAATMDDEAIATLRSLMKHLPEDQQLELAGVIVHFQDRVRWLEPHEHIPRGVLGVTRDGRPPRMWCIQCGRELERVAGDVYELAHDPKLDASIIDKITSDPVGSFDTYYVDVSPEPSLTAEEFAYLRALGRWT